jgi:hypothetical protein
MWVGTNIYFTSLSGWVLTLIDLFKWVGTRDIEIGYRLTKL